MSLSVTAPRAGREAGKGTLPAPFAQACEWQSLGKFHRAANQYIEILRSQPGTAPVYNNLGNCFRSIGQFEKAIRCYDQALALEPGRSSSRLNRGLAKLSLNQYRDAWLDYEARLEVISFRQDLLEIPDRRWQGQGLGKDGTLYLYGNQGLGDELQCLRFVPIAAARVDHVVLELQAPMVSLSSQLPDNVRVIVRGEKVPPFHQWAELFSLPGILDIGIDDLPAPVRPHYQVDGRVKSAIDLSRNAFPEKLHVGLVWSGSPDNNLNTIRACGLQHLEPLMELNHCRFHSLQMGRPQGEITRRGLSGRIEDLSPLLTDFAATATAVDALDLVITTDTSVPHLAGTLGAETWLMLHQPADWRWGQEGQTSAWYPSIRLFRQERMRDWVPVVDQVRNSLLERGQTQ